MTTCDVCISGWDGDEADLYNESFPKARRPHTCCECGSPIEPGAKYHRVAGKWEYLDVHVTVYRTCMLCHEIRDVFSCGRGFVFESLWEDMQEYAFERLTTASPCFTKLSAAAKQYVLERWNQWKLQKVTA